MRKLKMDVDALRGTLNGPAPPEGLSPALRGLWHLGRKEWDAAHAAGAVHLGKGIIERDIETAVPDKSTELILYCGGGYRSALAADVLQRMGYTNVFSMAGGWKAWKEATDYTDPK